MDTNKTLISIITVCYNGELEIGKTIESVLNQDFLDLEYIIIDGKSKDKTIEVIKGYEGRFKEKGITLRWFSEPDSGIYDAMNKGIDMATGDWMNFMNAGDEFHPEFSLKTMFSDPVYDHIFFGKSITYYKDISKIRYIDFHFNKEGWYLNYMPNHQAVFIPSNFCKNNHYRLDLNFSSDTQFLRKAFFELDYIYKDFFVSRFELGGVSNFYGSFKNFKKIIKDVIKVEHTFERKLKSSLKHLTKYLMQFIMGKDKYLSYYIINIVKEK